MASSPLPSSVYADDVAIVEARELRAGQRAQLHTRATDMQKVSHKSLPLTLKSFQASLRMRVWYSKRPCVCMAQPACGLPGSSAVAISGGRGRERGGGGAGPVLPHLRLL